MEERPKEQTMRIMGATAQTSGKRRLTRTFGQWAAALATAALVLIGLGIDVSADVVKQPDHGLSFEGLCKEGGGIYTETTEGDGNAWCQHEDGTQTVCSLEGTDCYHISSQSQPTGPLFVDDAHSVAPVDLQDAGAIQAGASVAPSVKTSVPAKAPAAAEASEMQP
ncbi:MAG TPA: hypothetical protein VFU81_17835 [Thermomicrobiales bacterium]|nr:hypothetical protein [Thermomicrobiales bacterium]